MNLLAKGYGLFMINWLCEILCVREKATKDMSCVDLSMIVMIRSMVIGGVFRELVMHKSEIA